MPKIERLSDTEILPDPDVAPNIESVLNTEEVANTQVLMTDKWAMAVAEMAAPELALGPNTVLSRPSMCRDLPNILLISVSLPPPFKPMKLSSPPSRYRTMSASPLVMPEKGRDLRRLSGIISERSGVSMTKEPPRALCRPLTS